MPPRTVAAYLAVLQAARDKGCEITRLKLAKLLYLADLHAIQHGDDAVSGVRWLWLNYGPYNNGLLALEDEFVSAGVVRRETEPFYGGNVLELVRDDYEAGELSPADFSCIYQTVADYGYMAATSLKDVSYQTPPMIEAQSKGRGFVLNMELARPIPKITKTAKRLRSRLKQLDKQSTDPGSMEALRGDIEALAPQRAEATTRLLDGA